MLGLQPDAYTMMKGVDFISSFAARNEKVLVHCKSGHGRGGAMTMAWLLSRDFANSDPVAIQQHMSAR
jgi:protein-tyrosine phosphatase